jgi:hypothetical protein
MKSVIIVNTVADSYDLTVLATVKAELGLTTTAEDANIETWIDQASGACATYCKRVFGLETVTETFRNRFSYVYRQQNRLDSIRLDRIPVVSVISVVEDTVTLVQDTDFWLDPDEGLLYRLDANQNIVQWQFTQLVVNYSGGYELVGGLPQNVERACIIQVQAIRASAIRDPNVKSENIPGVLQTVYWQPAKGDDGFLDPGVTALLDPYRNLSY